MPQGLSTSDSLTVDLGNIFESDSKDANWNIDVNQVGVFEIVLTVSSVNAADFNESEFVSVTRIELDGMATDKNAYYPAETVAIDSNMTNFNPNVTYTNLDLNIVITDPQDNNTYLHTDINVLYASTTQKATTTWANENKKSGEYKVTSYLYSPDGQMLDYKTTTFTVVPPTIQWIVGYGGKRIIGTDYNITYSLVSQPVNILKSQDINILFGIHYYLGD